MKLRVYHPDDCDKSVQLFYDTVHSVNANDYTKNQLNAWAPKNIDLFEWNYRLSRNYTVVAEESGIIVGFGSADGVGYFDLLYVHKNYQKKGVATLIADDIENYVRKKEIRTITTDASITAKLFFEKRCYVF